MGSPTEEIDILISLLNSEETKKEFDETTEYINQKIKSVRDNVARSTPQPIRASEYVTGQKQIDEILDSITAKPVVDKFEKQLKGMDISSLMGLRKSITDAIDEITNFDFPDRFKIPALDDLEDKFKRVNEHIKQFWDTQKTESTNTGSKLEGFLGRYKYSLLLIGAALGSIFGMVRYSATFGTMLDAIGSALGYIADTLLSPVIPLIMIFVEWLIGVGDYIAKLPDPIKILIVALLALGAGLLIIQRISKTNLFQGILTGLQNLVARLLAAVPLVTAAGALTAAGWITALTGGLLAGLAVVYILMQTGALRAMAGFGQGIKSQYPAVMAALTLILQPFGLLGIVINDVLSGQIDRIPWHFEVASKQAAESLTYLRLQALKSFSEIGKSVEELMITIGEMMQVSPLTAFMGKSLQDYATNQLGQYNSAISDLDNQMSKSQSRMEQWGNIARNGVNAPVDTALGPGSILNGLNYSDQLEALTKQYQESVNQVVKGINQDSTYLDLGLNLNGTEASLETLQKLSKEIDSLTVAQEKLNDAVYGGTASLDQITKLKKDVTDTKARIDALTSSMINLGSATQSVNKSGEKAANSVTGTAQTAAEKATTSHLSIVEQEEQRGHELAKKAVNTHSKYKNDSSRDAISTPKKTVDLIWDPTRIASDVYSPWNPKTGEVEEFKRWDSENNRFLKYEGTGKSGLKKPILPQIPITSPSTPQMSVNENYAWIRSLVSSPQKNIKSSNKPNDLNDANFSMEGVLSGLGLAGLVAWLSGSTTNVPLIGTSAQKAIAAPGMMVMDPSMITGNLPEGNNVLLKTLRESQQTPSFLMNMLNGQETIKNPAGTPQMVAPQKETQEKPRIINITITGKFQNDEELYQSIIKRLSRDTRCFP